MDDRVRPERHPPVDRRRIDLGAAAHLLPFLLLVTAICAVPLRIFEEEGLPRYQRLRDELAEIEARNEVLESEIEDLRLEVDALGSDPAAIEQVARDEFGMIREDEFIFQFATEP